MLQISEKGKTIPASPIRKLVPFADKAKAKGTHVYHLNIGQPDIATPDIALEAIRKIDIPVLAYTASGGNNSLRAKFAEYYQKLGINGSIQINVNEPILLKISYKNHTIYQKSEYIVTKSLKVPTTKEDVINHMSKLNDTPYYFSSFDITLMDDVFVPVKVLNDLRRDAIKKLSDSRLNDKVSRVKDSVQINPKPHTICSPKLTIEVSTLEQYELAKKMGIEHIYFKNIVRRNNSSYLDDCNEMLIGGLSSINYYKNKDVTLVSDHSLNVNNHISAGMLSSLGVERVTLSSELNANQIGQFVDNYIIKYKTAPNLEMIVYGRLSLMHSKYCPLKRLNMCGKCKTNSFALRDEFETFPIRFNDDCTINLLNGKILNLLDEINNIKGINYFRLIFTNESLTEMEKIISFAFDKLNNQSTQKIFDGKKHTRGNYRKQLL